jgi:hypothetical protein
LRGLSKKEIANQLSISVHTVSAVVKDLFLLFNVQAGTLLLARFLEAAKREQANPTAIKFFSCFISYSHADEGFAEKLYQRLIREGFTVWYAPEDMKGGQKLVEQIDSAIKLTERMLLCLSKSSMRSAWVTTEILHARQRESREGRRVLFPIRLCGFDAIRGWTCFDADSGKDVAREVRELFIPDFSDWQDNRSFGVAFRRLVRDLRESGA